MHSEMLGRSESERSSSRAVDGLDRVVILNDFSVMRGGATGTALASERLLRDRGVPVTFIAGDDARSSDRESVPAEGVNIGGKHILALSPAIAALKGLHNSEAGSAISKWIDTYDTSRTVYHLHGWTKILSPSVFGALRPVASRLVISAHDFFLVCPNGGYFNFQRARPCELEPMGVRCLCTACDRRSYGHKLWRFARQNVRTALFDLRSSVGAVLPVHDEMVPHLVKGGIPRERLHIMRNPVSPWRRARVRAESNRAFIFVGRLDEDKGADLLARAARRAGVAVRMIGDGPLKELLATEYSEVEQLGWRSRDDIVELVGDARVLVMPSRTRETFGIAALEAAMSGIPVVLSTYAMIADEVVRSGFGVSFNPYDHDAFASMLVRLAEDDDWVGTMSRRAFAGARDLAPTPAEWTERLLAIYLDVLQPEVRDRRRFVVQANG